MILPITQWHTSGLLPGPCLSLSILYKIMKQTNRFIMSLHANMTLLPPCVQLQNSPSVIPHANSQYGPEVCQNSPLAFAQMYIISDCALCTVQEQIFVRHPAETWVSLQQLWNNPPMDHSGMNMVMQLIILWIKDSNLKLILLKMCAPLHAALNKKQEWLCAFSLSWHYFIHPCLFLQATISTQNIKGNSKRKWLPRESKSVCSMSPNTERHIITNFNATMHVYTHMYTCDHVYMCTKCNLLLLYT